jgi:hypothetical protein
VHRGHQSFSDQAAGAVLPSNCPEPGATVQVLSASHWNVSDALLFITELGAAFESV